LKDADQEFQEIAHAGARFEFVKDGARITGVKISGSGGGVCFFELLASADGQIRHIVQSQGFMPNGPPPPEPLVPVWLISDNEGLFGRTCPKCKTYFRTDCVTEDTACPYCGNWDFCLAFTTRNQQEFITQYCKLFIHALEQENEVIVDLDEVRLADNKPQWLYSEERQQNRFDCKNCGTTVDVLGDYAGCPKCSRRNYREIIELKLDDLEGQLKTASKNLADRHEREVEWEKLLRGVSEFEAMAKDLRAQLMRLPATPGRKSDLGNLSFQRILRASECLSNWFGIEILKGISDVNREFLNKMFHRRHVFTHNAGRVDQEYIDNAGDTTVRLNEVIRLRSKEIKRLIPLIRQVANNLIDGYESIS
jgi:hypothetical protein